jgi:hypothetical protein
MTQYRWAIQSDAWGGCFGCFEGVRWAFGVMLKYATLKSLLGWVGPYIPVGLDLHHASHARGSTVVRPERLWAMGGKERG